MVKVGFSADLSSFISESGSDDTSSAAAWGGGI